MVEDNGSIRTLSVDIGGSGVKALVLDITGNPVTERARVDTPNLQHQRLSLMQLWC